MKLFVFLALVAVSTAVENRYDNYRVVSLYAGSDDQYEAVKALESIGYLYMDPPTHKGQTVDVIVPPHKNAEIEEIIQKLDFKTKVVTENLQKLIDNEGRHLGRASEFGWTAYYPLETIYEWIDEVAAKYPQASVIDAGRTYEGRQLKGLKISNRPNNPAIFIESNIHAREWISSAVSTWILNQLLTSSDPAVRNLAETIDWYVVPVANPDGFVYTHTSNRLWRKTRAPSSSLCAGADPNRNWDFFWRTGGSSSSACSDTYAGSSAFSEIETRTLSEYYSSVAKNITAYIDFHSYSQLLMYPYGASRAPKIDNEQQHIQIGQAMTRSLAERHGTRYTFGNIITTIYEASGGSCDWAKGVAGTPLVFVYELRDTGRNGFILPASEIIPNGEEVLDSLVTMVREARRLGYFPQ